MSNTSILGVAASLAFAGSAVATDHNGGDTVFDNLDIYGAGQAAVSIADGESDLDTRLVLGGTYKVDAVAFNLVFQTTDNVSEVDVLFGNLAYDTGNFGTVTFGRFQKVFSAELADTYLGFNYGLTNSVAYNATIGDDVSTDGIGWGAEYGDLSFELVYGGTDGDLNEANFSGRAAYDLGFGSVGVGFLEGDVSDSWTVDFSRGDSFVSYTDVGDEWYGTLFLAERECIGDLGFYGRAETGSEFDYELAIGATYQLGENAFIAAEYDYADAGEDSVNVGIRITF
tara:strand:+ start:644 stop:1495 length:852 start_codon:yes stop_codon:yes gene_type:complete